MPSGPPVMRPCQAAGTATSQVRPVFRTVSVTAGRPSAGCSIQGGRYRKVRGPRSGFSTAD